MSISDDFLTEKGWTKDFPGAWLHPKTKAAYPRNSAIEIQKFADRKENERIRSTIRPGYKIP